MKITSIAKKSVCNGYSIHCLLCEKALQCIEYINQRYPSQLAPNANPIRCLEILYSEDQKNI